MRENNTTKTNKMENKLMTASQSEDLGRFNKAKAIALTIEPSCRRRADATDENPFYGANFGGEPMVIWTQEEAHLTSAQADGRIELPDSIWYFKRVAEWTILQG
jgi:hypothetical protein